MEIPLVCFLQDSYDKVEDLQVRDAAAFFVLIERELHPDPEPRHVWVHVKNWFRSAEKK